MRSRLFFGVLVGAAMLAGTQAAHSDVRTASGIQREASIYFNDFDWPVQMEGYLTIYSHSGATSQATSVAPRVEYRAAAAYYSCDYEMNICTASSFDWQTVDPTSLTMDPLANTVQIDACLLPTGGGGCRQFDLTLSRPSSINVGYLCFPSLVCGVNAWHDPATGQASASVYSTPGLVRNGYGVSGTFAGNPFPSIQAGFLDGASWQRVVLDERVELP